MARLGFINIWATETFIDPNISETDDPMDIDIARIENEKGLATIEGKIGDVVVSIVIDSASNKDIMPKIVADELGLKIDTSVAHSIRGVSGENRSLGTTNASIKLASGCVIEIEPIVIDDYPIREIILGRSTLRRYNYDLHESRKHMVITCNEKNFFIPIVPDKNRQSKLAIKKSLVLMLIRMSKKKYWGHFFYALIFCRKFAIRFGASSLRLFSWLPSCFTFRIPLPFD